MPAAGSRGSGRGSRSQSRHGQALRQLLRQGQAQGPPPVQSHGQHSADAFKKRLQKLGIPVYIHYTIPGYPHNVPLIVSDEGYTMMGVIRMSIAHNTADDV